MTDPGFKDRWRRVLAATNLLQFCPRLSVWTTREVALGFAPELPLEATLPDIPPDWRQVVVEVTSSVRRMTEVLAERGVPLPAVAWENCEVGDDAVAEMAWPDLTPPVALLAGDQESLAQSWRDLGWTVVAASMAPVEGEEGLKQALQASLEEWRIFLHPCQRKLVEWQTNGPMCITGAAGTGKTVALLHRAAFLARKLADAKQRDLVTTFTTNLVATPRAQLRRLAPDVADPGESEPGVRMGTMKRVKGLEFRAVALACADPADPMNGVHDAAPLDRCERYVAATRAREHLLITVSGCAMPAPVDCGVREGS